MVNPKTSVKLADRAHPYTGRAVITSRLAEDIESAINLALAEDLGLRPQDVKGTSREFLSQHDLTTSAIIPAPVEASGKITVKSPGVIAGLEIARRVFTTVDPMITFIEMAFDGDVVSNAPQEIALLNGNAAALLLAERTALNFLQRLSGIATAARKYAQKATPAGIAIVDTRKTTPGLRSLEKHAVWLGSGNNHRFGLFDAVLIKDNHIAISGGVRQAIEAVRKSRPDVPIEVEVSHLHQLNEALSEGVEIIMLDNMQPQQVREAVRMIAGRSWVEVSGGINLNNIDTYLIDGVDAISIGELTHSIHSLDISFNMAVRT